MLEIFSPFQLIDNYAGSILFQVEIMGTARFAILGITVFEYLDGFGSLQQIVETLLEIFVQIT